VHPGLLEKHTMWLIRAYIRRRKNRPHVRPWALAVPVAILLFCLPLLRPLRHPGQISSDEELRLASISALVEHARHADPADVRLAARLAIDTDAFPLTNHTIQVDNRTYSDQAPMLAILLSGPYWILNHLGYRLQEYSVLVPYLLTLLGVTLPAAGAAGLIYRMSRIFELRRPWRTGLAAAAVFGSGLISYAVVLNAHVPAAVLVLGSAGCLVHLSASKEPSRGGAWLMISGFSAALAATIDPPAIIFLALMLLVIPFLRLRPTLRVGGVLLYLIGACAPLMAHAIFIVPITGNLLPGSMHAELSTTHLLQTHFDGAKKLKLKNATDDADDLDNAAGTVGEDALDVDESSFDENASILARGWRAVGGLFGAILGDHGVVSHFPIVILGVLGMFAVMHRHWPATTKAMAAVTAAGAVVTLLGYAYGGRPGQSPGYANRWFIVFLPLLVFWAGAWMRRRHHPAVWAIAGVLLTFSILVSLIGAANPLPRGGYDRYTPVAALKDLVNPSAQKTPTAVAGR
jgi:hypothetical protein